MKNSFPFCHPAVIPLILLTAVIVCGCSDKKQAHKDEQKAAAIYYQGVGSWRPTSTGDNCPSPREFHTAVWTGSKMIIWGGGSLHVDFTNTGGQYNPVTDSWASTSTGPDCPNARFGHTAVWTGSKMIIWGGMHLDNGWLVYTNTGGVYDPVTDTWTPTSTIGECPSPRREHTAIWTGSKMIVWGGDNGGMVYLNSGGIYDPATDTWTATSTGVNCPKERAAHISVWTGIEMIIWGGFEQDGTGIPGGLYNPETDTWKLTSTGYACPPYIGGQQAVWAGNAMIVYGGRAYYENPFVKYFPDSDTWHRLNPLTTKYRAVLGHSLVYTGEKIIVWGGFGEVEPFIVDHLNSGGIYDPPTDEWELMSKGIHCPSARTGHTAVWTGTEMIIWGGYKDNAYKTNTGGVFTP